MAVEVIATTRNVQSKRDPKTSYGGIVENRFTTSTLSCDGFGVGGKEDLIWTTVDKR